MEKDPEITGLEGSHYTAPFWEYDSRIARRWNVDPVTYPWQSSYATFNNNPILYTDPDGLWGKKEKAEKKRKKIADKLSPGRVGEVYNRNEGTDKKADWGFKVYNKEDKAIIVYDSDGNAEPGVAGSRPSSYLFSNKNFKNFKRYHLGEISKVEKGLEKADEIAEDYVAPIVVKVIPPTAVVDAGKTIITGVDLNGTVQEGAWNRVISPVLTIGTSFVGSYAKLTTVSKIKNGKEGAHVIRVVEQTTKVPTKVSVTNEIISKTNTVTTGVSEANRIYKEDKK